MEEPSPGDDELVHCASWFYAESDIVLEFASEPVFELA